VFQEAQQSLKAAVPAMFQPDKDTELTFLFGIITMIDPAGSTPPDSEKLNQMCCALPIQAAGLPSVGSACSTYVGWLSHGYRFAKPCSHLWAQASLILG